jgi:hypothetical protein
MAAMWIIGMALIWARIQVHFFLRYFPRVW